MFGSCSRKINIRVKEFTSNLFEIIFSFKIDVNETIRSVSKLMTAQWRSRRSELGSNPKSQSESALKASTRKLPQDQVHTASMDTNSKSWSLLKKEIWDAILLSSKVWLVMNSKTLSDTWLYFHAQMMEISMIFNLFWEILISKLDVFGKDSMNSTFHVILKSVSRPCSIQIRFSQIFNLWEKRVLEQVPYTWIILIFYHIQNRFLKI